MRKLFAQPFCIFAVLAVLVAGGCGGGSRPISVSLSPSSTQTIDQGQTVSITATVANDSAAKGVTWNVSGGGTLTNSTSTSVTYNAPTSVTSQQTATVTATSVSDTSKNAALTIKVNPAPSITTTSLPNGTAGQSYSQSIQATGGTTPYAWSVTTGSLPNGLSLSASTGAITGTPTGAGTSNFTVQLKDSVNVMTTQALSITVGAAATLTISTTSLPSGTQGTAYSQTLAASGGVQPYTWSVSVGTLPAGLSLSASTGAISGTPTGTGTSAFTVMVTDSGTPTHATATKPLSITINAAPLVITTTSLPNGTNGTAYSATLQATGGVTPYAWSISSGSLPSWATLNASTGQITGTPNANGTTSFTVQVADSAVPPVTKTQALSITINPAGANNSELKGQYAFLVQGFDTAMAASITTDGNGNITAGTEDIQAPGVSEGNFTISSGTYSIGSDNRGTLTFTDNNGTGKTYTFAVALGSISAGIASKGAIVEFDANFSGSSIMTGSLALQNVSAGISGPYAIQLSGWDKSVSPAAPQVFMGSFTGVAGQITNGLGDNNDNGTVTTAASFSGTYPSPSTTTGRTVFTVTFGGQVSKTAGYVISAGHLFLISQDTTNTNEQAGQALSQTIPTGGFSASNSLTGNAILNSQDEDTSGPNELLGIVNLTGTTFTFSLDNNQAGTVSTLSGSGTAAVDAGNNGSVNGRFTFTPTGSNTITGYMIAPNQAFFAMMIAAKIPSVGSFEPQTAGPFTQSSLNGTFFFGTLPINDPGATGTPAPPLNYESGVLSFSNPNITGTSDTNSSGTLQPGGAITDTYTVGSNGRVTTGSGKLAAYIVSANKIYVLRLKASSTPINPTIIVGQQ